MGDDGDLYHVVFIVSTKHKCDSIRNMNQSKIFGIFAFLLRISETRGGIKCREITAAVVELIRPKKELVGDKKALLRSGELDI